MPLFIVRHQHAADGCPAQDPFHGASLLNHLSRPNLITEPSAQTDARLVSGRNRYSWQWWELMTCVEKPGKLTLRARATDLAGRTRPERAEWNRLGYGNNAIQEAPIRVE